MVSIGYEKHIFSFNGCLMKDCDTLLVPSSVLHHDRQDQRHHHRNSISAPLCVTLSLPSQVTSLLHYETTVHEVHVT